MSTDGAGGPEPEDATAGAPAGSRTPARRRSAQFVAALLAGLLGFGIVSAARPEADQTALSTARQADLLQLLDEIANKQDRLEVERLDLLSSEQRLRAAGTTGRLAEAQRRADSLAVLAGTAPVTDGGIAMTVTDPEGTVDAATLLTAVQELRDAGAVAMSIGATRVVANTWFGAGPRRGTMLVSGTAVAAPYAFKVVGDPQTLSTAMKIPGGVSDTVRAAGGAVTIEERDRITVGAIVALTTPEYAEPVPGQS